MSQQTLDALMRAALMTRAEAISHRVGIDNAWEMGFAVAMQAHMNDEACRWLAAKGCYHVVPDGTLCPGVLSDDGQVCDRCMSQREVNRIDAEEAVRSAIGKETE